MENNAAATSFTHWIRVEPQQIRSLSISKNEIEKLLMLLKEKSKEALEIEIKKIKEAQLDEVTKNNIISRLEDVIKKNGALYIQIYNTKGQLTTNNANIIEQKTFPKEIAKIIIDNNMPCLTVTNTDIHNRFKIEISFNPCVSSPTNDSFYYVVGTEKTWVSGVSTEISDFFDSKKNNHSWLHSPWAENLILIVIGIPVCLWVTYIVEKWISTYISKYSSFFQISINVYVFFVSALALKGFFNYSKKIFPNIEYLDDKKPKSKFWCGLGAIMLPLVIERIITWAGW